LDEFEAEIEAITLLPSDGGQFEVLVNDRLIYSKLQTHRHTEPGEVSRTVRKILQEGL
jgi:selenoprotein W-related protein